MLVGEQPGNEEDLAGEPFVGPAGRLLDRALDAAGIDRRARLRHQRREALQVGGAREAAHPPEAERRRGARLPTLARGGDPALVRPRAVVCLGATAAQALLGRGFRVTAQRGAPSPPRSRPLVIATVHPSSILRAPDDASRRAELARFVEDLARVAALLRSADRHP